MTRIKFDLTPAQSQVAQPLYDELLDLSMAAISEGKAFAGATITGQLLFLEGHDTPTVVFVLLDPETSAQVLAVLEASRERRRNERQA